MERRQADRPEIGVELLPDKTALRWMVTCEVLLYCVVPFSNFSRLGGIRSMQDLLLVTLLSIIRLESRVIRRDQDTFEAASPPVIPARLVDNPED